MKQQAGKQGKGKGGQEWVASRGSVAKSSPPSAKRVSAKKRQAAQSVRAKKK